MRRWVPWALGGLGALWLLTQGYSYGGAPVRSGVDRDPKKLLPAFAKKVDKLFAAMRARGFQPMLWEGYRTPARAAELEKTGAGVSDSMHSYGAAVDVVDGKLWAQGLDPWKTTAAFWKALGEEAERLGLTWGGRFTRADTPHVQAVSIAKQNALRSATPAERQQMVA